MSRFFVLQSLTAYTPGEQPRDRRYLKLNTKLSLSKKSNPNCSVMSRRPYLIAR